MTMRARPLPGMAGIVLALLVGATWASNAVGGGTVAASLAGALAFTVWGWRRRHDLRAVLLVAFAPPAMVLAGILAFA